MDDKWHLKWCKDQFKIVLQGFVTFAGERDKQTMVDKSKRLVTWRDPQEQEKHSLIKSQEVVNRGVNLDWN